MHRSPRLVRRRGLAAPLTPEDCVDWRYGPADEPASLPAEYDRDDYKRTSLRDPRPELHDSPQNQCGQKGAAVDLAWGLSRGSDDVVIAVLDSGIRWRDAGAMADLATKAHIDLGEAPPPCAPGVADGDCNGDGVFDIADFGADHRPQRQRRSPTPRTSSSTRPATTASTTTATATSTTSPAGTSSTATTTRSTRSATGTAPARPRTRPPPRTASGDVGTLPAVPVPARPGERLVHRRRRSLRRRRAVRARPGCRRHPGGARRASATPARPSRRSTPPTDVGVVVVASMADEASKHPNLPGVARAHDGGQLGDREGDRPPGHARRGLPRAQRLHELRRSHLRVGAVELPARRRPPASRPAWSALLESYARAGRRRRRTPRCRGCAGDQRAVRQRGDAARAGERRRHRLLDAQRGRPGQQLRHADGQPAARHGPLPDPRRVGRDPRLRPHQRLRDAEGGRATDASRPRR